MKLIFFVLVTIIGAVITIYIDTFLGINLSGIGDMAQITHKVMYILWGGCLYASIKR